MQTERIIAYLKTGRTLTGLEALALFGTMKLATRISEIKRDNPDLEILTEMVTHNGKNFARYSLKEKQAA